MLENTHNGWKKARCNHPKRVPEFSREPSDIPRAVGLSVVGQRTKSDLLYPYL